MGPSPGAAPWWRILPSQRIAGSKERKEDTMQRYALRGLLAVLLAIGPALTLWATPIFDPLMQNCNVPNCGSVRIDGIVSVDLGSNPIPWNMELFAFAGACLRVHVVAQTEDWEAVLVAPDGTVWRDDDSGGNFQPLI